MMQGPDARPVVTSRATDEMEVARQRLSATRSRSPWDSRDSVRARAHRDVDEIPDSGIMVHHHRIPQLVNRGKHALAPNVAPDERYGPLCTQPTEL